jgi:diacylglycerol kinase
MKKFIQTEIASFKVAFNGLKQIAKERHFIFHLIAATLVFALGIWQNIDRGSWLAITFAIALVMIAEAANTVIEKMVDYVSLEKSPKAKLVKDMGAGMVLIAAFTSIVIGLLVFV